MTLDPITYSRRVAVLSVGLSPQVVTETLFALGIDTATPFQPTEMLLFTSSEGRDTAQALLLNEETGSLAAMARDWEAPWLLTLLKNTQIIVPPQMTAEMIEEEDFNLYADCVSDHLQRICADNSSAVHISVAGGRKFQSAAMAIAGSLHARDQDRMSHVLVEQAFASNPAFHYPTRETRWIQDNQGRRHDTSKAKISLVSMPFPRLGRFLKAGPAFQGFAEAVERVQTEIASHTLEVNLSERCVIWGDRRTPKLQPKPLAFITLLARDLIAGGEGVPRSNLGLDEFTEQYARFARAGDLEKFTREQERAQSEELKRGNRLYVPAALVEQQISKINKLADIAGIRPRGASLVGNNRIQGAAHYRLSLAPSEVTVSE